MMYARVLRKRPAAALVRLREQRWASRARSSSPIGMMGSDVPWDTFDAPMSEKHAHGSGRKAAMAIHQAKMPRDKDALEPSFYSEEVDRYAAMDQQPVTIQSLLKISQPPLTREQLLENAQFLCHERPIRYAKRVKLFQQLPFIVNLNPYINSVYRLYYANFEESRQFPLVETLSDERAFIGMLTRQSQLLRDIMPQIARGFYECRNYFCPAKSCQFLDQLIKMRIGLRLLTSQHIALFEQFYGSSKGGRFQGIVDNRLPLAELVRACAQGVQSMCEMTFGMTPPFVVDGQIDTVFRYIPGHLDYMLNELLKNAFHASIRAAQSQDRECPVVAVTISKGNGRVAIRIRDCGGGIPAEIHSKIFEYSFTTEHHSSEESSDGSLHIADNPVSGLGFGLPMTKIYAEYFGGSLNLISMEGHGCDAFLELPSIKISQTPIVQI
ncbi:hypothetical protein LPJ55_005484 [Coemansia sp. RSA 990]|nr:hypothetical protein LPJ55_005484 [Coemansia sp. RSA 990]